MKRPSLSSFCSRSFFIIALAAQFVLGENLIYHLNFDELTPGPNYTEEELRADLKVANGIGFADSKTNPTDATNRASIDPNMNLQGPGNSLKVRFHKNQIKPAASGIDARVPLKGTYKTNDLKASELFLSYWIKFSPNFDFSKCGGKLPSLGGDYISTGDRWKGRIMWRTGGSIQFYPELEGGADSFESNTDRFWSDELLHTKSLCTSKYGSFLDNKAWHNIELHYKFETPGQNDGYFEGWVDGDKGHKSTNSDKFGFWRPQGSRANDININYLLLSAFLGGSDPEYEMDEDTYIWLDEFKVSENRINEYSSTGPNPVKIQKKIIGSVTDMVSKIGLSGIFKLTRSMNWNVYSPTGAPIASGYGETVDLSASPKGIYLVRIEGQSSLVVR